MALVAVCLGYFMVIIDTTIVNVAVPALQAGLHADVAGVAWVIDGYLLMLAALVLSGGALADRLGAHKIFQIGLGVFTVASVICGLAPDVTVLIIARLIQGASAAMSVPASLSLLRAAFPDARLRARAILGLFSDRSFAGGNAIGVLINLGFFGELFVLNLYLQRVLGYSALLAGVALLPQLGVLTIGSALSGRFTARMGGPRPALLIGLTVGGAGLLGLILTEAHSSYLLLIGPLLAVGFGMSFTTPAAITAVIDSAPADRAGLAAGAINGARQLGGVIGIAVLGALVTDHPTGFIAGLHVAVIIAAAAFWLGGVIAAATVRTTRHLHPLTGGFGRLGAPSPLNAPGLVDETTAEP